jgi:hypothetical protein
MKVGLAIFTSVGVNNTSVISALSSDLKSHFSEMEYGQDIKSYIIGIICMSPQFEQFYKEKKPKYTKEKEVLKPDGIPITIEKTFEYSIKIDYESFKNATEDEARKLLAKEILVSLVVFEKLKSKIKDFDMNSFKADLEEYFKSHNLI